MSPSDLHNNAGARSVLHISVADDALLRTAVRERLQRLGHSVDVLTDGREAIGCGDIGGPRP